MCFCCTIPRGDSYLLYSDCIQILARRVFPLLSFPVSNAEEGKFFLLAICALNLLYSVLSAF
jgi:hypothetical protein